MTILIYLVIFLISLAIFIKIKERNTSRKILHTKTGQVIPHTTILSGIIRLIKRFGLGGSSFDSFRSILSGKQNTVGNFFLGGFAVATRNSADIRNILSMKQFSKANQGGIFTPLFRRYLGDSLLIVNDEKWVSQRKVINSAMSYSKIKEFIPIFNGMANLLVDKIKENKEEYIELEKEFTLMTFDVIGKAGFGFDFGSLKGSQNVELRNMKSILGSFTNFLSIVFGSLYDNLPFKKNKELKDCCEKTDTWIHQIIEQRRLKNSENNQTDKKSKDLLDLMIEAEKEENVNLSSKDLHNNIFLFFFAGHDTSSSALTSVLYFLAKNQEYIEQAKEEVSNVLEGRTPNFEDLQNLPLCNAIIKESIRIHPPAPLVTGRVPNEDVVIDDYHIPKGTLVICPTFMCHFDEKYWESPYEFNPKRFLDNQSKEAQKNAYFPFGYGPRRCPGDKFALAEICITLVAILQNFQKWELPKGWKYEFDGRNLTTKPKGGMPLKFF